MNGCRYKEIQNAMQDNRNNGGSLLTHGMRAVAWNAGGLFALRFFFIELRDISRDVFHYGID